MKANHPPELRPSATKITCDFLRRRGRGVAAATMVLMAVVACDEGPASPTGEVGTIAPDSVALLSEVWAESYTCEFIEVTDGVWVELCTCEHSDWVFFYSQDQCVCSVDCGWGGSGEPQDPEDPEGDPEEIPVDSISVEVWCAPTTLNPTSGPSIPVTRGESATCGYTAAPEAAEITPVLWTYEADVPEMPEGDQQGGETWAGVAVLPGVIDLEWSYGMHMRSARNWDGLQVNPRNWSWNQSADFDYRDMTGAERNSVFQTVQAQWGSAHPDYPTVDSHLTLGIFCTRNLANDDISPGCLVGFVRPASADQADSLTVQSVSGGPNDGMWYVEAARLLARTAAGRNPHIDPGASLTWGTGTIACGGLNWDQANQCMDTTAAHRHRLDTLRAGIMYHETFGLTNKWGHEQVSRDRVLANDPYPLVEEIVGATQQAVRSERNEIVGALNQQIDLENQQFDALASAGQINPANRPPMTFWWFDPADSTFKAGTINGG